MQSRGASTSTGCGRCLHPRVIAWLLFGLLACGEASRKETEEQPSTAEPVQEEPGVAAVDAARLIAADAEPGSWMSHGRTYSEQRFSPLDQIDTRNVKKLGLSWYHDLRT